MTVVDFLQARLGDDVALARQIQAQAVTDRIDIQDPRLPQLTVAARVVADVEAKRQIIDLHTVWFLGKPQECSFCITEYGVSHGDPYADREPWPCTHLRLLAAPYSDHPDFDPAWSVGQENQE